MGDSELIKKSHDTRVVSATIPEDLYWSFKKAQAERKESAQDAVVSAIRLYLEVNPNQSIVQLWSDSGLEEEITINE